MNQNIVSWFEIPASDLNRAKTFYEAVFDKELMSMQNGDMHMFAFPWVQGAPNSAGAIVKSEYAKPSAEGTLVYLECEDVANELARVEENGGKVVAPKMSIGEFGFIGQAMDTEGNRIGLHSAK
jgi:predicted enzyme related to lactoylglutathione lyase